MLDVSEIRSLSDFQRNTRAHIRRLKKTGKPQTRPNRVRAAFPASGASDHEVGTHSNTGA